MCVHQIWPDTCRQGRIKLFGAPRQWKYFRPLFQAVFLSGGGGGHYPPDKHHASQSQDRNNKYFILYIEFCINNKIENVTLTFYHNKKQKQKIMALYHQLKFPSTFIEYRCVSKWKGVVVISNFDSLEAAPSNLPP